MGKLVKVCKQTGARTPYSEQQLRNDHPSVLFPRNLATMNLAEYGVELDPSADVAAVSAPTPATAEQVPMHCFLWGVRCFNLRTQFERYVLHLEGHARDYWMSAPYVRKTSTYFAHFCSFFQLNDAHVEELWGYATGIEE